MGMHPLMTRPGIGVPFAVAQIDVGAQSCGLFSFKMFGPHICTQQGSGRCSDHRPMQMADPDPSDSAVQRDIERGMLVTRCLLLTHSGRALHGRW